MSGCATEKAPKNNHPSPPPSAVMPGQEIDADQPMVLFRGMFKKPLVQWVEGLHLAEGLLEAQFQGLWSPTEIVVIRQGKASRINANRLLRGQENPALQPGDIVEIRR